MRNKHLFFIDPQSSSNLGVYDYNLLRWMTGIDITFYGSIKYQYRENHGTTFKPEFKYSNFSNNLLKAVSYTFSIFSILIQVLHHKPDVIHIQWIRLWFIDYCFALWLKWMQIPVVYTAHNVLPHNTGNTKYYLYKKYYQIVYAIISHTERSKEEISTKFNIVSDKIAVIPHGLLGFSVNRNTVERYKNEMSHKIELQDKVVFSVLGTQSLYKGSDIIAKTWLSTPSLFSNKGITLIIAGMSSLAYFAKLKNIRNVHIIDGFIPDEQFEAILDLSTIILMPYRKISQSGVLLSALNARKPIIVSNVGGLTDPLRIENIGWNIGQASVDNLQSTILDILEFPNSILSRQTAHWDNIHSFYDWREISKRTFELYCSLIKKS